MLSKEEIEKAKENLRFFNEGDYITREMDQSVDILEEYIEDLETEKQKLEDLNNNYLQKLVYALTPTQHALGDDYNNAFKQIIAENINLETCKIKRKLKECWGINEKY